MKKYEKQMANGGRAKVIACQVPAEFADRFDEYVKQKKQTARHDQKITQASVLISALEKYMA